MSSEGGSRSGVFWAALAAIGGMMSGVAAVLGLFIAKPDTINILIPQQTLQQAGLVVVARQETDPAPAQQQPPTNSSQRIGEPTMAAAQPPPAAQQPIAPPRTLAGGLEAALLSLTEQPDRYVATFRFTNASEREFGVAVLSGGFARAEFYLSDGVGGSCQMAANGEGWGSLDSEAAEAPSWQQRGEFRAIPGASGAQHTIFFNKRRCDALMNAGAPLAISGSFVIESAGQRSVAPVSFDRLALAR